MTRTAVAQVVLSLPLESKASSLYLEEGAMGSDRQGANDIMAGISLEKSAAYRLVHSQTDVSVCVCLSLVF